MPKVKNALIALEVVSAETINIKNLQRSAAQLVDAQLNQNDAGNRAKTLSGAFALMVFKAAVQGMDVSYRTLKERLSEDQLKACKSPASKAVALHLYLAKGNSLEVDGVSVTIDKVIGEAVVVSTAYAALLKAQKAGKEAASLSTMSAIEEVSAYIESGKADRAHLNIPTDALTQKLAYDGDGKLDEARVIGREYMAKMATMADEANKAERVEDAIRFLQEEGYSVTK